MAKYIDREALIEWLKSIPLIDLSDGRGLCRVIMEDDFKKAIKKMPKGIIADVEPVKHGRWIMGTGENGLQIGHRKCSRCGEIVKYGYSLYGVHNFCNYCGADMRGRTMDVMKGPIEPMGMEAKEE